MTTVDKVAIDEVAIDEVAIYQAASADSGSGIAVVIPARNEERRLGRALGSMRAAASALHAAHPDSSPTRIVVVLDGCTDGSRAIVDRWPEVEVLEADLGNVGAARAAGVDHLLASSAPGAVPIWIACTDADSAVRPDWLVHQYTHARGTTDLLLGLVDPDPTECSPALRRRWRSRSQLTDGHPHVHGANLGVRTEMYGRAGGFPPLGEHEDVALAERIRRLGGRVVSTAVSPVLTSARTAGRTGGGMAGYLAALARES